LDFNFGDEGYDVDRMLAFVISVESRFYPAIIPLYEARIRAWAAEQLRESGID
jgi:hypothetical protein